MSYDTSIDLTANDFQVIDQIVLESTRQKTASQPARRKQEDVILIEETPFLSRTRPPALAAAVDLTPGDDLPSISDVFAGRSRRPALSKTTSDIEVTSSTTIETETVTAYTQRKSADLIILSSSPVLAPQLIRKRKRLPAHEIDLSSPIERGAPLPRLRLTKSKSDVTPVVHLETSAALIRLPPKIDDRTLSMLAALDNYSADIAKESSEKNKKENVDILGSGSKVIEKDIQETTNKPKAKPRKVLSEEEKRTQEEAKTAEKERKEEEKRQKLLDKQREKEAKAAEKAQKEAEKRKDQELVALNRLKTSKKDCTPEMIVDIDGHLLGTALGQHLRSFLEPLSVEHTEWESPTANTIRWRRKVSSRYDESAGYFVPIPPEIQTENRVLCFMKAKELADLVGADGAGLDTHAILLKSTFPSARPIYMIEGLAALFRRMKTAKNRQYTAAVRNALLEEEGDPAPSQSRRKQKEVEEVDEELVEEALISLQITHECLIVHTTAPADSAEWIAILTSDIATIPYKTTRQNLSTSFCVDVGQVKTGIDIKDTFSKMLQEVQRVTPQVAAGVMQKYPSLPELLEGFKKKGPEALANVPIGATKTGALSSRTIGVALSKKIHNVFTNRDPAVDAF
ncbi:hypothetical protein G7K_5737-t1 [Saitoella complicata NRRL Y-17804]|uniref:ERCC4 domain-containing protein n=1 Tax=Saitoella complicata (strain BCRC 22490 / CBS 7301 / JCM 7358 / NBRC 10748 / NRRL Y-17804) TaxID=698492 RepID=A0A0E9NP33_SAICN|nr:hypothetical protein G7K_5737-t1 [Saitoella complicata NRRL Y-17804]